MHNNWAGRGQIFQINLGGRGIIGRRGGGYQRLDKGMCPSNRRSQIQGRDIFRDGARGSGKGTSNSSTSPVSGVFRQTPPWDGGENYKDGQETSKEIGKEKEEAEIEDGFPANRGSSGSKSSLGFQIKGLCVGRSFVYVVGF